MSAYNGPLALNTSGLDQNALGGGVPVELTGFVPAITMVITWGTHIVFTEASSYPAGDSFASCNIEISDEHGNTVLGSITGAGGTVTPATTSTQLVQTDKFTIKAIITSTNGCIGDGLIDVISSTATSALANWSISFTTSQG